MSVEAGSTFCGSWHQQRLAGVCQETQSMRRLFGASSGSSDARALTCRLQPDHPTYCSMCDGRLDKGCTKILVAEQQEVDSAALA